MFGIKSMCRFGLFVIMSASVFVSGCASPSNADQGAVMGGLGGAGLGALIGSATGHAGAGALIGGGVGALSGAVVGNGMDQADANNRAMIAASQQRMPVGTVTVDEVISMTQAHVDEEVIMNHVHTQRMVAPVQAADLVRLQESGVNTAVIKAMQDSPPLPPPQYGPGVVVEQPGPVIVGGYYYRPYPHSYWHY